MSVPVLPFAVAATLIAAGVTLMLERGLVRVLGGMILLGNGINLLIVSAGGPAGAPPLLELFPARIMGDPLPQAMVLTSIVITLGITAFLLAMVYRTWQLTGTDEVQDDTEDRRVRLRARRGELGDALVRRREAYQELIAHQRAELERITREEVERERRDLAELERDIRNVSAQDKAARIRALREAYRHKRREQAARERGLRRKLRGRYAEARREMRTAIRAERERQALALDPELEGDE
ncbi:Na(+)/H(+) antiporter subunit C [Nonomuraea sp. NBC_01738]|uniref:Na(+)/H(+) antiporter subunit C n=1 Tax=Nonomuraea sp. NBC_01738 TaxID=2976003 RepID=UPI002E0FA2A3|nr:Na(+)/H(+) antiporter subunit C [Nonomuraea sp. NBC_01738]